MAIETIKSRRDFLAAQQLGKKFITPSFILRAYERPKDHPITDVSRFGFTVTKKLGGAVQRNRIKRRLREATREVALPDALAGYDYVFIARGKILSGEFSGLLKDIRFAFSHIHGKNGATEKKTTQ